MSLLFNLLSEKSPQQQQNEVPTSSSSEDQQPARKRMCLNNIEEDYRNLKNQLDKALLRTSAEINELGKDLYRQIGKTKDEVLELTKASATRGNSTCKCNGGASHLDPAELERIIQQRVDEKIVPMAEEIRKCREENATLKKQIAAAETHSTDRAVKLEQICEQKLAPMEQQFRELQELNVALKAELGKQQNEINDCIFHIDERIRKEFDDVSSSKRNGSPDLDAAKTELGLNEKIASMEQKIQEYRQENTTFKDELVKQHNQVQNGMTGMKNGILRIRQEIAEVVTIAAANSNSKDLTVDLEQIIHQRMEPLERELQAYLEDNAAMKKELLEHKNQMKDDIVEELGKLRVAEQNVSREEFQQYRNAMEEQNSRKCLVPFSNAVHWCAVKSSQCVDIQADGMKAIAKKKNAGYHALLLTQSSFDVATAHLALSLGFHALYYFEIEILAMPKSNDVYIGLDGNDGTQYIEFCSDGKMYCASSKVWIGYGNGFREGDVVGCGLVVTAGSVNVKGNIKKAHAFLCVNGIPSKHVDIAIEDGHVEEVWPCAGLGSVGSALKANFGQDLTANPFSYDPWKQQQPVP